MAEIELVIKIDEDEYKARQRWFNNPKRTLIDPVDKAIALGTVFPKGHGDLLDRKWIVKRLNFINHNRSDGYQSKRTSIGIGIAINEILNAPIIIEADGKSEDAK